MAPMAPMPHQPDADGPETETDIATGITTGAVGFSRLVDTALRERTAVVADPRWGLTSGELRPQDVCRYAAGCATESERRDMEGYLLRAPWAMQRVTALVKGARTGNTNPLAGRILEAARQGDVDPYRTAAAALFETLGHGDARGALERGDDGTIEGLARGAEPLLEAACRLGLGQVDAARVAFTRLSDSSPSVPLAAAARRVAEADDDEAALVELLNGV